MWISDIETAVFSRIKARGSSLIKNYPNIFFTAENESDETVAVFPTVLVQELNGAEEAESLDGGNINAYSANFQISIAHNGQKADVRKIMNNVMDSMKEMKFNIVGTPFYTKSSGVWNGVARFRRTIGSSDTL